MDDLTTAWLYEQRADVGVWFLEDDGTWRHVTYEDLAARTWALADELSERGLAGQRLAVVAATDEDCIVQVFATLATGGTCVPLPHLLPGQSAAQHQAQVEHILGAARPAAVLRSPAAPDLGGIATADVPAFADLNPGEPGQLPRSPSPALIQFTTGMTGLPKGVRISRPALDAGIRAAQVVWGLTPDDRGAVWLPWSFIGVMVSSIAVVADEYFMSPAQFFRDPAVWLRCFGQLGCTRTSAPTFGYLHVLQTVKPETVADCRFDGWRAAYVAAEPPRVADLDAFVTAFGPLGFRRETFCPAYGLSESTLSATQAPVGRGPITRPGDEGPNALVGSGVAMPGARVAVRLPDGSDAPDGTIGEIFVGGETLADGYEPGPDFGEWVATGDAGCFHDGELFVVGRLVDSFQYLGERVYAPDAEAKIHARLRGVTAVVVVPIRAAGPGLTVVAESTEEWPKERGGEAVEVVSGLFRGIEVDLLIVPPGGIPRTPGGKPQRRECFNRYVAGDASQFSSTG